MLCNIFKKQIHQKKIKNNNMRCHFTPGLPNARRAANEEQSSTATFQGGLASL